MKNSNSVNVYLLFLAFVLLVVALVVVLAVNELLSKTIQLTMLDKGVDPLIILCYDDFKVACSRLLSSL